MKTRTRQKILRRVVASATIAAMAIAFTGCYIGRANFEGENMHLYPLWHTTQTAETPSAASSGVAEK